jgi:uncharacterized repeat protein (TIGR04138 family)
VADPLEELLARDPRYRVEAYLFVHAALPRAQQIAKKDRHVTGQELLEGIRRLALEQFGLMAKPVLNSWGVRATDDFGNIVFNLVNAGLLGKTDEDRVEDFHAVYDFDDVFVRGYSLKPDAS